MYEPIRQLIRENRLRKAMHSMNQLDLSREHASRLVTLDRRLRIIENKQIGNLSEERLLTIEENGLVQDMLVFLDQVEYPHPDHGTTGTKERGAAAGTGDGSKKGLGKWFGFAAVLIALLAIGFLLWPEENENPDKVPPIGKLEVPPTGNSPTNGLTDEEKRKLAQQQEEAKRQEELRQQEAQKEKHRQELIAKARRQAQAEAQDVFMSSGKQVDMAVAVYAGPGNLTKADASLSKSLSGFLSRVAKKKSVSHEVLTSNFHNAKERDLMFFGRTQADKRLSSKRARYLVLADVRNVNKEGKAQMRMCIYDTATGKSMIHGETVNVGTAPQMQEKYILYAMKAFITEKLALE